MIETGNVVVACLTTGLCTMWAGWSGLVGSIIGQIVYYAWLRHVLFA
jgi:adenosylcobinamide amidohydrolase